MEEDPKEIMQSVYECMERTCEKLCQLNIDVSNIKGEKPWKPRSRVSECVCVATTPTLRGNQNQLLTTPHSRELTETGGFIDISAAVVVVVSSQRWE